MASAAQQHTASVNPRKAPHLTLDDEQLSTRCPLDNGRHPGEPQHSLGQLDLLPTELLREVLASLDVPSLTTFRRVNRRAMSSVDSLREYAVVFKHCPDIIRAIVSTNADGYSCRTLFKTLTTTKCDTCRHFGYFLYVVSCKRVCYWCFKYGTKLFPVIKSFVSKNAGLRGKKLDRVLHVLALPWRRSARPRVVLYDIETALEQAGKGTWKPRPDQDLTAMRRRFLAIISAPHLDDSGRSADWGHYCTGCKKIDWDNNFFRKYTKEGFVEHLANVSAFGYDPIVLPGP